MEDPGEAIELGLKFRSDVNGYITGIRFYKGGVAAGNSHTGHLWTGTGTSLGSVTFTNETATGWQQALFSTPIAITANTTYVVSYFSPNGNYLGEDDFFYPSGVDNPPLHALRDGFEGPNGLYLYTSSPAFPTETYQSENYWVDVVFSTTPPGADTTPPTVTSFTPASGATNVSVDANITVTFSEAIDAATVNSSTIELRSSTSALIPATVNYNPALLTATLDPNGRLMAGVTYTARVKGGGADPRVKDVAGNALAADLTRSFTVAELPACPCSVWGSGVTPTIDMEDPGEAIELGLKFRSDVNGYITGIRFYKGGAAAGNSHTGHLWTIAGTLLGSVTFTNETEIGWQQALFSTPIAITANTTYVVSYFAPQGNYPGQDGFFASSGVDNGPLHALKDGIEGGNGLYLYNTNGGFPTATYESENYWVDVVFSTTPPGSPPTVSSIAPAAGATNVNVNMTVTAVFNEQLDVATVNGSTVELRDQSNVPVPATVRFITTGTGYKVILDPSEPLAPGTTYTARLRGGSTDPRIKDLAGDALAADVVSTFTTTTDGTPPTVTSFTPASGATNVNVNANITLTFSEAMNAASINAATVELRNSSNVSVPAIVSYDAASFTATLDPNAPLEAGMTYTVRAKGGGLGTVIDLATNWLAADLTWSFTTADTTPPTVTSVSPASGATNVAANANVTVTFSEAMNPSTISASTIELRTPSNALVSAAVSYNETTRTATLDPAVSLAAGTTYTARVRGGSTDPRVKDVAGNALAVDKTWTFTTLIGNDAAFVSQSVPATMTAGEPYPVTVTMRNQGANTWTPEQSYRLGSQNPQDNGTWGLGRVNLSAGDSVSPGATTTFSFVVTAPSSPGSYNFQWQMVQDGVEWFGAKTPNNIAVQVVPPPSTLITVYPTSYQTPIPPGSLGVDSPSNTEHGATTVSGGQWMAQSKSCRWSAFPNVGGQITRITLKFNWSISGVLVTESPDPQLPAFATARFLVRYFNGSNWTTAISKMENSSISGPGEENRPFSDSGSFSVDLPANTPINQLIIDDELTAEGGGLGSGYGGAALTARVWDIRLEVEKNITVPPTVTSFSPPAGASNVNADANVIVTFSDAMDAATLNGSTLELRDPSNALVPATVSYNAASLTATLNPTAPLSAGTYTVRVRGGGTDPRVKNMVGNSLVADVTWTFATWPANLSMALIDPINRIGLTGEDLLSRNYNWSLPLLSLPGRAGLDLGLTLSLNSLSYTKAGSVIYFDPDLGYPAPGFRLGFPEIRNAFINTEAGAQSYLLIMPSGRRVEFRQINTNVYQAVDSSYMLLTYNPMNSVFILYTTDGTQCRFVDITGSGDYKCVQIKDRNGNYITIGYGSLAEIKTVTDTLGRVINFNYDDFNHLLNIRQDGGTLVTFAYGTQTIQTNFQGLTLNGTANGQQESVLLRVGLPDGSVYSFDYNTYAQVKTIRRYAPNNSNPVNFPGDYLQLAYTTYGLPDNATNPQTDCPRITSRTDWAYDWNNFNQATSYYAPDSSFASGQVTFPDGTIYKEFFATAGWQRGLTTLTENWTGSGGMRKKWTEVQWTQDNTSVGYKLNPRVTETRIHDDAGNQRRTKTEYTDFGLPRDVSEYEADATTVLRRTHTEYNLSQEYLNRRIIGLPSEQLLYDGNNTLFSKVTYEYDKNDQNPNPYLQHQGPPIQHDTANYGPGFVQGRGNLNKMRRWDMNDPNIESEASEYETGYNTSGSVIFTRDPLGHQTSFSYDDNFTEVENNQSNQSTYAYPTMITDPDNFQSYVRYNYVFGAVTWTIDPKGAAVRRTYDAAGRLNRVTNQVNGAYTRYDYGTDQRYIASFTTVNDLPFEFFQYKAFDGHGRMHFEASEHPGSAGGYKAVIYEHNSMGRLARQTNPTEVYGNWVPAGDDAAGWVWSYQSYDWKGRPTVSTNQDGTTKEVIYGGCGCAGGQVVVVRDDVGRRQKVTYDILGRLKTTQTLFIQPKDQPLDGNGAVYSTRTNTYNVRDQVTNVNVRDDASGVSQNTQMVYDGHGRLKERWLPIYLGNPQSATPYDSYEYYPDDTLMKVTDPRGASATYGYNNRHLVTSIDYGVPGGVAATPNVSFGYDEVGNRTWMDDGPGNVSYIYDTLSRMESETRAFDGLPGSYKLVYEYNLAGQVKRVGYESSAYSADNSTIYYTYNNAGEMMTVTGSPVGGVTQYLTGMKYRAWGGLKSASYGNGLTLSADYTARQQPQQFEIAKAGSPVLMKSQYSYYDDGRIRYARDFGDDKFDRAYSYDHAGRLQEAYSGTQARDFISQTNTTPVLAPYRQTNQHNVWNNLTSSSGHFWGNNYNTSVTYNSGREQELAYDTAGNVTSHGSDLLSYDAASRNISVSSADATTQATQEVDGNGIVVRQVLNQYPTYYLRSAMLGGQVIVEINGANIPGEYPLGGKRVGYVYAGGTEAAKQLFFFAGNAPQVYWSHTNPLTGSRASSAFNGHFFRNMEPDPSGGDVGLVPWSEVPPTSSSPDATILLGEPEGGGGGLQSPKILLDGVEMPWRLTASLIRQGVAVVAPTETVRSNNGSLEILKVNPDGTLYWDSITGGGLKIKDAAGNVIDSIRPGPGLFQSQNPIFKRSERQKKAMEDWMKEGKRGNPPLGQRLPYPCITMEDLLNWEPLLTAMNTAWDTMKKTINSHGDPNEIGGWAYWDASTQDVNVYISPMTEDGQYTETYGRISAAWPAERAWESFAGNNPNIYMITEFHTHLSGNERSSYDAAALGIRGWPLFIIVQGINKHSAYNDSSYYKQAPPEELKKCLPLNKR